MHIEDFNDKLLNTINKIDDIIKEISSTEYRNKKLIKHLNNIFSKKGLNQNSVSCIFDDTKDANDLDNLEKIAFFQGCYDILKLDKLNPKNYFSLSDLSTYDTLVISNETEIIDKIILKDCRKINDKFYQCYVTAKQLYLYEKNSLVTYNKNTQRAPRYRTIGGKKIKIREAVVNRKKVEEMKNKILNGFFFPTEIYFNVLVMEGKEPQFKFSHTFNNIGDIEIKPNYDRDSINTTYVNITDGQHRKLAYIMAYEEYMEKTGSELDVGTQLLITFLNEEEARRFVRQQFERSDTDEEYLQTLVPTDYDVFSEVLMKKIEILNKSKISLTYDEMIVNSSYTHRGIISKTIKETDINVSTVSAKLNTAPKLAKIINYIIQYIFELYNNDLKYIKENTIWLSCNAFSGYIGIATILKDTDYEQYIVPIVTRLIHEFDNKDEKTLKRFQSKTANISSIYKNFSIISLEVINNE